MRPIKFRAWDKDKKCIFSWSFTENGIEPIDFFNNDNYIVMQYTGLHDKFGKEIYEKDIVEYSKEKPMIKVVEIEEYEIEPFRSGDYQTYSTDYKIIGNVYEHPTLLTNQ